MAVSDFQKLRNFCETPTNPSTHRFQAIGGALGTGLIIGTGSALAKAGPASILISYSIVGIIVYVVMCALGEMATWLPTAGGFANYATRFVDPALGFSL